MQKTSRLHRLLAVIVAVFMAVCCLPLSAFAEGETNENVIVKGQFVTADGENVSAGDYFVPSGTQKYSVFDQYLPEGYKSLTSGDLTIVAGETYVITVEKISTDVIMNVVFMADGQSVGGGDYTLPAGIQNYSVLEQYVPAGYKMTVSGDFTVAADTSIEVPVEKISTDVIMNVVFMADGQSVGGGDYFLPEGVQNYTILNQYVPAGYKLAESGDFMVTANGKLEVRVEKISTDVIMNVVFMADGQSVGGGDYFLPEGVQNYTILNQYVPAGYKLAESGDFMVTANGKLEVRVEKISTDVIMNIVFKTADGTVAGGGDYFLPEGVQKLSILDQYVPAGYKICETGDFMVTANGSREVRVEKISNTVIMNIVFKTAEGYVAGGGDYFLPEGVQNYKILNQYVPEGYRLCVTGDFMVTDGGHETVRVEKIPDDVIVKTAVFRKGADDVWNENEDNPDEVRYSFFSDDPEATNTVPSITTGDKTKVLDYWVSERDDSVTLKPGAEFCFNDLKKGDLGNEAGDFAFYPVYKDAPKTPADGGNTSSGSSNSSNSNTTTVTATNDNGETVVKAAAAPANNSAKILPQTGVAEQTPVAFGVMMFAALAGAAAYLFAIRKKLN